MNNTDKEFIEWLESQIKLSKAIGNWAMEIAYEQSLKKFKQLKDNDND